MFYFPERLERAIARVRPAGGADPLVRIVEYRCVSRGFRWGGFDAAWAWGTLAAAYPEEAVKKIDRLQRSASPTYRGYAVHAASKLPDELAWPRLLVAAADPVPGISECARQCWLDRRGALCPVDELAGIETDLLDAPLDERARTRLALLRTAPREARAAMVEVLFGEAPDPAALALLIFALGDDALWHVERRPGLPKDRVAFGRAIVAGFGDLGVKGLCAATRRFSVASGGFFDALAELAAENALSDDAVVTAREAAALHLAEGPALVERTVLSLLAKVGAPPALFDRLWALSQDSSRSSHLRDLAGQALARLPEGDARVETAVREGLLAAQGAQDIPRFAMVVTVGLRAKLPLAVEAASRLLDEEGAKPRIDAAIERALEACRDGLSAIDRLSAEWEAKAFASPDTYAFGIVMGRLPVHVTLRDALKAARRALSSQNPATVSMAAYMLIWLPVRPRSVPSLDLERIVARAPPRERADLLELIVGRVDTPPRWWPWIKDLLVTTDEEVASSLHLMIWQLREAGLDDELRAIEPSVVDPRLRGEIAELFEAGRLAAYWKDEAA